MTELHTGELTLPAPLSVVPVNKTFRVSAARFAAARRATTALIVILGVLALIAVLPWLFVDASREFQLVHWASIALGSLTALAAIVTWGMHAAAKWWLEDGDTVLTVTNDEIVIRGTIRIPTNTVVGAWGYSRDRESRKSMPLMWRLLSLHGANTSSLTLLVGTMAPVVDPHHRVRRFTKDEEAAGRIEIPVGSYFDHPGALEEVVATIQAALIPGRPALILSDARDYASVWRGYPSQVENPSA